MPPHTACPIHFALELISRKWSIHILMTLVQAAEPLRFGQLQKAISGISQRELTKHLREFEACGLVSREVFPQIPPRVEYTLTKLGASLLDPIMALNDWAETHGSAVLGNRAATHLQKAKSVSHL